MIYSFKNDYSSIAHPLVLKHLLECQNEQNDGYGMDKHTANAKGLILDKIKNDSDIYFVTGGTQANMVVISALLRPHEAVICAESGHINTHEAGAIEGQGHKCIAISTADGKLRIKDIEKVLKEHSDMHMVKPKMIYISNTTELGGFYKRDEIIELSKFARKNNLYLYMDGARLASALAASDLTYEDLGKYLDVFYIGGTKNGGYIGEAIVINNDSLKPDFSYLIKHYGALLAKGFVGAIPFEVLMEGNIYKEIGRRENECAYHLAKGLNALGIKILNTEITNQLFIVLPNKILKPLYEQYPYEIWQSVDESNTAIRLVTSFTTRPIHINGLIKCINELLKAKK